MKIKHNLIYPNFNSLLLVPLLFLALAVLWFVTGSSIAAWGFFLLGVTCLMVITYTCLFSPTSQFMGETFYKNPQAGKMVALTFDDGPDPTYTPRLLDILKGEDIKATFFVVGRSAEKYPDMIKRIINDGHELGNHAFNHTALPFFGRKRVEKELKQTQATLQAITKENIKLFRPPFGFRDPQTLNVAHSLGFKCIQWSIMTKDWKARGVDKLCHHVKNNLDRGDVILFHDGAEKAKILDRSQTLEAVKALIPWFRAEGYELVTVSELMRS